MIFFLRVVVKCSIDIRCAHELSNYQDEFAESTTTSVGLDKVEYSYELDKLSAKSTMLNRAQISIPSMVSSGVGVRSVHVHDTDQTCSPSLFTLS